MNHYSARKTEGYSKTRTTITSANELRIEQTQACWIENDKYYPIDLWSWLVAPTGTKGGHWSRLVPPTGTKGLVLELARCGGMFSPTSLAERLRQWFISAAARTTSSSSQLQAYGPKDTVYAYGPTGPSAGLNPGPTSWLGF